MNPSQPPLLECALSCDNLLCDGLGRPPSPRLVVAVRSGPGQDWRPYARTETVPTTSNPAFLLTVGLRGEAGLGPAAELRVTAQDLRERLSGARTCLGTATTSLAALLAAPNTRLRLPLTSPPGRPAGFLTITGWRVERAEQAGSTHSTPAHRPDSSTGPGRHTRSASLPPPAPHCAVLPTQPALHLLYTNPDLRTYRFHSGLGGDIAVLELMAEPKLAFTFPQQLL